MRIAAALGALTVLLGSSAVGHAENLIKNGGFEKPASPSGYFTTYSVGQTIEQWTVVGSSGNVATVNDFEEGGVLWSAHHGKAFLDLTGTCDCGANSGVAQTVATLPGTTYVLTFWVGNTVISGQGDTSTVDVYNGSTLLTVAENKQGKGSAKEVWRKFKVTFVATATTTTLSFVNGDPTGDEQNGLDDISLVAQ